MQQSTILRSSALFLAFFTVLSMAFSQEEDKKKWDVNAPEILNYKEEAFTVDEGTWMNIDASPDGKMLAFDLLGDIYTMPIEGGKAKCIRSGIAWEVQPRWSPDGTQILFTSDAGGGDNMWLMDADGEKAKQVTKESFRLLNNATWLPDGDYFIARKHFTSTRSLGAGEMWMFHKTGGAGIQLTKRKNDQQDQNEPSVSPDGRYVYFSEDMYPGGYFQYNKDPNKQIFQVRRYDRETGEIEAITGGTGSAFRPQASPDGKWLAFVRRVRTKTVLFVHNLETGQEYTLYDNLTKDQAEAWTVFGIYPGFSWLPNRMTRAGQMSELVFWSKGKIWRLGFNFTKISPNDQNTVSETPQTYLSEIPFSCDVVTKLAETVRSKHTVFEKEITIKAIRQAITSPDERTLIFNAAGYLYEKSLPNGTPKRINTRGKAIQSGQNTGHFEFEPCFSPDGQYLVYVTWDDEETGAIWRREMNSGRSIKLTNEKGQYRTPSFSPDGKKIAYVRDEGDDQLGFAFTKKSGIYTMDANGQNANFVQKDGSNPRFSVDGQRLLFASGGYLFGALEKSLKSVNLNGKDEQTLAKIKYANQWAPSPDGKWLAFTELHQAYVCPMPMTGATLDLSGDSKAIPVAKVSRDAGYNLHWSADSKKLHWTLGDSYFTNELKDRFLFLPGAPDSLPAIDSTGLKIGLALESDAPKGVIAFTNARIITMEGDEVIENGTIIVKDNKITALGKDRIAIPDNAFMVDCKGKTIMPGIIDAHAHSGNFRYGLSPQKQWEYYANLAYGVTTSHDPSANSEMVFSHSELLKTGQMVGPRLFSTGTILYGAEGDFKAVINSLDDARSALRRTAAFGAFSVKSYNQPRREQRQWVMAAAQEQNILVVPEGGSFFYHNLSMVADGHTGVEHNIPVAPLHEDVIQFWKRTHSHNTPTLIVCYGAVNGEYYFYQHTNVWEKKRLLNFTPRSVIDERSRHVTQLPEEEYENGHILVSQSCKKMQDAGININLGAHGQLQGLGAHWELWMLAQGGMSAHQALKCATINGATYLGLDAEIGSLKVGKLADLVVMDKNPLEDIRNSESISYVMVNGRLYNPDTLDELGNTPKKRTKFWFEQPGSQINGAGLGHTRTKSGCVCGH